MARIDADLATQGAVLVEERVLRRIIKGHRKLRGVGLQVPHETCYALPRAELEKFIEPGEIAVEPNLLPEHVVVVRSGLTERSTPEQLTALWRSIFHAKVHEALDGKLARHELSASAIRERINRIGQTEFDEIRSVLKQEDLLLPPVDDVAVYIEFVALYLELHHFAPAAIDRTFPALFDTAHVDATVALDVDGASLLVATRPPGAPDRPIVVAPTARRPLTVERGSLIGDGARKGAVRAALRARNKGNRARAAILHCRGGQDRSAETDLGELVARLAKSLAPKGEPPEVDAATSARWVAALLPVAQCAATQGRFAVAARLLLDLQAACVVGERETKVADVFGWATSLGKKPITKALPATREVRIAKHVHAAVGKIPACGVPSEVLTDALHEIAGRADGNVRRVMRPKIESALDEVGLHPHSLPERVGEKKLVDEMLDRAVEIGRLTIGNLRDSISNNDLKTNDLTLEELKNGDQLLRSDRILAKSMDGVYRRGESYMRFLQKLSSLLFGTPIGRFLTLYAILPWLGSIAVIEGLHHMIGPLAKKLFHHEPAISTIYTKAGMAIFLFLLIHVVPFRRIAIWVGLLVWKALKLVLWTTPRVIWRHPIFSRFLESPVNRWLIRPAIPAGIAWLVTPKAYEVVALGVELRHVIAGGVFLVTAIVTNSRFGRIAEERIADWAVRSGRHVTTRLLPGAFKLILELFQRLVELFDRGIYRVDEWLRFRTGTSRVIVAAKATLATLWFIVTYFLRLYINLFVEPTVNPIKHFPVVTVAAKLIIPIIPSLLDGIGSATQPLFGAFASTFAGFTVIVLPGLAGFLVWELKENWKLYRATRSRVVKPLSIGHHGETMIAFLKPGFHSGTIPKLYTRLRRAAWKSDDERGVARAREGLHHVEESIDKFVDRQLVSMLNEVPSFTATDVAVAHVEIGSNRIQIALACPSIASERAHIRFEQQSGWLVASIPEPGWLDRLDDHHRRIFEIALSGFYKLSGVEIVREQVECVLRGEAKAPPPYDIADEGLLVWPTHAYDIEAVYDLRSTKLAPAMRGSRYEGDMPDLIGRHALFSREPLYWSIWSTAWQQIARGEPPMHLLVGPSLLPPVVVGIERAA